MTCRRLACLLVAGALTLAVGLVTSGAPAGAAESDTTGG
jgi:hypothetical protein